MFLITILFFFLNLKMQYSFVQRTSIIFHGDSLNIKTSALTKYFMNCTNKALTSV